jgi:2-methylisocitrate lyase-like PEP mutase family enzyme
MGKERSEYGECKASFSATIRGSCLLATSKAKTMNPTTSPVRTFRDLHSGPALLLLPNAWDAASALLVERAGGKAVATSSVALAWSLGYADGGQLPRPELVGAVARIARVLRVPLSVDIEDGYSADPQAVSRLVADVVAAGAVGINLEDGGGEPQLLADKIAAIRNTIGPDKLFINARTDVYLRRFASGADAVQMALQRLRAYRDAGADGAFVPGLADADAIAEVARGCAMPLNLMTLPGLPAAEALTGAGVKRLSMGPGLFLPTYAFAAKEATRFLASAAAPPEVSFASLNAAFSAFDLPR